MNRDEKDSAAVHWAQFARTQRTLVGPPLVPTAEDIGAFEAAAAMSATVATAPLSGLVLGVTPELARMAWPPAFRHITAIDLNFGAAGELARALPPGERISLVTSNWRAMPLPPASIDLAAGDGSFNSLDSLDSMDRVAQELTRVLKPRGRLVLRIFAQPSPRERPAQVFDDLRAGRIGRFTAFKLRLLMATPAAPDGSIRLSDTWTLWTDSGIDRTELAAATGWPRAAIDTIDSYRGNAMRFVFLTLADMRRRLAPHFEEMGIAEKTYELGALCPTLYLRARTGTHRRLDPASVPV